MDFLKINIKSDIECKKEKNQEYRSTQQETNITKNNFN